MSLLAFDLGGTKLALAQFSLAGEVLRKETIPLADRMGNDVGDLIAELVASGIKSNEHTATGIRSIGISVPGISRSKTGTVWAPNIPGWEDYPLLKDVKNASGKLPVAIDSDRSCSILGETWKGNANSCTNAIFLAVGTGIGAGILVNGTILRGEHDIAGAIGWMALNHPFVSEYVACGCFEYYASGHGISRVAQKILRDEKAYTGPLIHKATEQLTAHDVFEAYAQQDPIAIQVFKVFIEYWGMAVANLVSIFNPEKIIFGGGVFGPAVQFIPAIRSEAVKWAQPISIQQVVIESSALGTEAAVYGAGYIARQAIDANAKL